MAHFNMSGPSSYIPFFTLNAISRLSRSDEDKGVLE
jgi:hypothetical protein